MGKNDGRSRERTALNEVAPTPQGKKLNNNKNMNKTEKEEEETIMKKMK